MKLIARNEGPRTQQSVLDIPTIGCLTPGKEYEAISIRIPNNLYKKEVWAKRAGQTILGELKYNPRDPKFYIKVIDDNGREHDIWNDYFLSTEEIREMNLNKLLL